MDAYVLSAADVAELKALAQERRLRVQNTRNRDALPEDRTPAPEMYVAKAPSTGVPGMIGEQPGSADCAIYRLQVNTGELTLVELTKPVYNIGSAISLDTWLLVSRDKFGSWYALADPAASTLDPTGGCADLQVVDSNDCLTVSVVGTPDGRCSAVSSTQTVNLAYNTADSTTRTVFDGDSFVTDTANWHVDYYPFDFSTGTDPQLVFSDQAGGGGSGGGSGGIGEVVYGVWLGCYGGGNIFAVGGSVFCGGAAGGDCARGKVLVKVACGGPGCTLPLSCCTPTASLRRASLCVTVAVTSPGTCGDPGWAGQYIVPFREATAGSEGYIWTLGLPPVGTGSGACRVCADNGDTPLISYLTVQVTGTDAGNPCQVKVTLVTVCQGSTGTTIQGTNTDACGLANSGTTTLTATWPGGATYNITVSTNPADCPTSPPPPPPPPPLPPTSCPTPTDDGTFGCGFVAADKFTTTATVSYFGGPAGDTLWYDNGGGNEYGLFGAAATGAAWYTGVVVFDSSGGTNKYSVCVYYYSGPGASPVLVDVFAESSRDCAGGKLVFTSGSNTIQIVKQ